MTLAIPFTCKSELCSLSSLHSCSMKSLANIMQQPKPLTENAAHCMEPHCWRTSFRTDTDEALRKPSSTITKVVISDEWPALQHRESSPNAVLAFQAIIEAAGNLNVGQPNDPAIQGQILALLSQAHAFRETRIFQANQGLPIIIWLVLSFYGLVLVVFVLIAGVESRIGHLFFTAIFATSVVLVFVLVRMLDYPFEGALMLSNDDFVKTIGRLSMLIGA